MKFLSFVCFLLTVSSMCVKSIARFKQPTVFVAILIRNKAHTLPYFLSLFEQQNYPKDRMHLWIHSDNNIDNSIELLNTWLKEESDKYHGIDISIDKKSTGFEDEKSSSDWSPLRFSHIIKLREEALDYARKTWSDFIWMLDADTFLTNPNTLRSLVLKGQTVVAPLLKSDGMYSNFWAGMTKDYYYLRTERYQPILYRENIGCFDVPMIHSSVLINLRTVESDKLTYDWKKLTHYDGPMDDVITFAVGANNSGIPLHICNDEPYGYVMVPLENDETIEEDLQRLTNIKLEILSERDEILLPKYFEQFITIPQLNTLNFDNIYMINLIRRPEKRVRMYRLLNELGVLVETIDAVDGRHLNDSVLEKWGINIMPDYMDPYHKRPMTMGEVGCFLSHYLIWNKVLEHGYERVMVLEDDVHFEPFFRQKLQYVLSELNTLSIKWDLIYIGRKRLVEKDEPWVQGSKYLVYASYSYWTLGYILSASGARKLVNAMPLEKLLPVDEYIPVLSNTHPRSEWKSYYPQRDLIVLSANPLLIHPTHYTGDEGYISDTENSKPLVNDQSDKAGNDSPNKEEL